MTEKEALAGLRGDDPDRVAEAEAALWEMWQRSGDPAVEAVFARAIEALEQRHFEQAERLFGEVIQLAPGFAEGWNKRATVRYVLHDYPGSIADCEATLARNPHHFGALSGQGLCHLALGQYRQAAAMFRRALAVHPHLRGVRENLAHAIGEAVRGNGHEAAGG